MKRYVTLSLLLLSQYATAQQEKGRGPVLKPEISAGGGFTAPLGTDMKDKLAIGSGQNVSADVFLPLVRIRGVAAKAGPASLGLTVAAGYTRQQSSGALQELYGNNLMFTVGNGKAGSVFVAAGPRFDWQLNRFRISPNIRFGYINLKQEGYTMAQQTAEGLPGRRVLSAESINAGGLLVSPGVRTGFNLTDRLSVWNSLDFGFGPSITALRDHTPAPLAGLMRRTSGHEDVIYKSSEGRLRTFDIRTGFAYTFDREQMRSDAETREATDAGRRILYPPQPANYPKPDTIYARDKKPVTLIWEPVTPKPDETVLYRVILEQAAPGTQQFTEIFSKETPDLRADVPDRIIYGKSEAGFRWKVQGLSARTRLPLPDCVDGCNSDWAFFALMSGGCVGRFDVVSDTCQGMDTLGRSRYRICGVYTADPNNTCNISFYDAQNAAINSMPGNNLAHIITDINGGTVSNYAFTPVNPAVITPGGQVSVCFDYTAPGNSANFVAYALCLDGMQAHAPNFANDNDTISLEPCICKDCAEDYIVFSQDGATFNSQQNTATINGNLQIAANAPVKRVEIQVNSFSWTSEPKDCSPGITQTAEAGMFRLPASLGGNWPGMPALENHAQGNISIAKALKWINGNGVTFSGSQPLSFTIGLPGGPPNVADDCCKRTYTLCLTIVVEDMNCKVCTHTFCLQPFTN